LKLPPADDAAGDFHERFVNEAEVFESNAQAPEVMQQGSCALDDPSGFAKATAVRLTSTGDLGRDARSVSWPKVFVSS
jgi:hypothetical protein